MKILKTRWFARFARREAISDASLCGAVRRAERGLLDADLGRGIIKQRIARKGQGRSGGYRVLLAHRRDLVAVFLYGFAKNERENIRPDELAAMHDLAKWWLGAGAAQLALAIEEGVVQEVRCENEKEI